MTTAPQIEHVYTGNSCELKLKVDKSSGTDSNGRSVQNIRNCDIFIEDYHFLIYLDVRLYQFHSFRRFDMKDLKNIQFDYSTKDQVLRVVLPCLLSNEDLNVEKNAQENNSAKDIDRTLALWKLKKITDDCLIRIDDNMELLRPDGSYDYGFASKFRGSITSFECDMDTITRMPEPCDVSPLQRTIDREIDEMKNFCRDQYKLNFVELQVPDGLDNPMNYTINFKDCSLTRDEECLLHNLTSKPDLNVMPDEYDVLEIDCGLINILLAICYDVRFTSNEPNCESAWTRSVLSATLTYFEPFTSLKNVVVSFMRRSLIYPLYRNYELSRQCVEDCVIALQNNAQWIVKQLLITHDTFESNERSVFNHYYIDDYIRYVTNKTLCPETHLLMLAHNLKNVLLDVFKKHLGLGLQELETELLKELITDMHIVASASGDECDDNGHDETESDEGSLSDSSSSSSSSDSDGDSVIEQKMNDLKL